MPQMTGDGLTRALLSIRPELPVILCSGFTERASQERAGEIGIRRFIEKPFDRSSLARCVRDALDQKA